MKSILCILCCIVVITSCKHKNTLDFLPVNEITTPQIFEIKGDRDTTLVGRKGTVFVFKANSFLNSIGQDVKGDVVVSIKEFYTVGDFINNRLSTITTDGKLLKSSGMVFIQAKSDTSFLRLKNDHAITIMFKRIQESRTANLFSGEFGLNKEMKWNILNPVHNDTITIRKETITRLSYGEEKISVYVKFVIGNDTVERSQENEKEFEKILNRSRRNQQDLRPQELPIGDSVTAYYSYESDPNRFYVFETTNLGYLNCDIYVNEEMFNYTVKLDNSNSDVFIIVDSLNSVLYPFEINNATNEYIFNLPRHLSIVVVAYRKNSNKHFFAIKKAETGVQSLLIDQLDTPLNKIREAVKKMDRSTR